MLCSTCNLEYPEYLNFCRRCGKPLVHSTAETAAESHCCTRCGARIVKGENFCQQCGNRANLRTKETVIGACHHCGTSWRSGWLFCKNCGLDRDHALMPRVSAPASPGSPRGEVIAALEEYLKVDKIFCPKCGVEAKPFSKFCESCGMTLDQVAADGSSGTGYPEKESVEETEAFQPAIPTVLDSEEAVVEPKTVEEMPRPAIRTVRTRPDKTAAVTASTPRRRPTEQMGETSQTTELSTMSVVDEAQTERDEAPVATLLDEDRKYTPVQPIKQVDQRQRTRRSAIQTLGILAVILFLMIVAYVWWVSQRSTPTQVAKSQPALNPPVGTQSAPQKKPVQLTPQAPDGMVYIPGGQFLMGRDDGDEYERPSFSVTLKPFFIDRTEVTNEDYLIFVNSTGHRQPNNWQDGRFPEKLERYPVTNVSWEDAIAYARWANKRLPTEEEWEFAARGSDGRKYPWGEAWAPGNANAAGQLGKIHEVGSLPNGASPYGVLDMAGNVWEWTDSDLTSYTNKNIKLAEGKVIRGGAYDVTPDRITTTYRGVVPQDKYYDKTGFRCVRDLN